MHFNLDRGRYIRMNIQIPYGTSSVCCSATEDILTYHVAELPDVREISFRKTLKHALHMPEGTESLSDILKGKSTIAVVFSDKTRKYPFSAILSELGIMFEKRGIQNENVTLLCAAGLHTQNTSEDCRKIAGEVNYRKYRTVIHNAESPKTCVYKGMTSYGTEVYVNRLLDEVSCVIVTGTILPHYYAGFSGGRKGIIPGAAAAETIRQNHSLNFHGTVSGRNTEARSCNLNNNPVHLDMVEAASMAKPDFLINTTMIDGSRASGVFCGDMIQAHESGCRFYYEHYRSGINRTYDLVLAGTGGYPKDCSLYQSHKAIDNAFKAVGPGGILIVAAKCIDGFGKEGFREWLDRCDISQMEDDLKDEYHIEGHTAYCLKQKTEIRQIFLVSGMDPEELMPSGLIGFSKLEKAFTAALIQLKKQDIVKPEMLVIPDGSQFII